MKKIIFAVMAVAAISFATSCGNKTQQAAEAVDSVALVDSLSEAAAQEDINAISALFESGDAAKLQEALATVKEKIANLIKENPEVAKEYVAKVQEFLKENADKVKAIAGDSEAAVAAVAALTEIEPEKVVTSFIENVGDAATEVKDAAVDAANEKVEEAKAAADQKVEETKEAAKKKASDAIDNAASSAKSKLGL
ncbi:MAG: hypothetical protein IJ577_01585 [Prevotella sp.]|nr:hypothetical protein [Prevotella sp.]